MIMNTFFGNAQNDNSPQMADYLRQNGKIYVVVAVIGIIFAALVAYLFRLDKKVSNMEKKMDEKK